MEKARMIAVQRGVKPGEKVWNGYVGGQTHLTAPSAPGSYTLYELASFTTNTHVGWQWVKEKS